MRYLLLLLIVSSICAADRPLLRLNDSFAEQTGTPVYDFIDPVTNKRFLVVKADTGTAMIEATPAPVAAAPVPPPAPVVPPGPPKYWEEAQSYSFKPEHAAKGWELVRTSDTVGGRVYHLRRKNPNYKGPALEDGPLEKQP